MKGFGMGSIMGQFPEGRPGRPRSPQALGSESRDSSTSTLNMSDTVASISIDGMKQIIQELLRSEVRAEIKPLQADLAEL